MPKKLSSLFDNDPNPIQPPAEIVKQRERARRAAERGVSYTPPTQSPPQKNV